MFSFRLVRRWVRSGRHLRVAGANLLLTQKRRLVYTHPARRGTVKVFSFGASLSPPPRAVINTKKKGGFLANSGVECLHFPLGPNNTGTLQTTVVLCQSLGSLLQQGI